jgi:general secretion pathway protein I
MRARGFTLLEVMVALSVLATALVALLSLHARNIQIVGDDRQIVRATLLAQAAMTEILLAEPFPEIGERGGEFEEDPGFAWRAEFLGPGFPSSLSSSAKSGCASSGARRTPTGSSSSRW